MVARLADRADHRERAVLMTGDRVAASGSNAASRPFAESRNSSGTWVWPQSVIRAAVAANDRSAGSAFDDVVPFARLGRAGVHIEPVAFRVGQRTLPEKFDLRVAELGARPRDRARGASAFMFSAVPVTAES